MKATAVVDKPYTAYQASGHELAVRRSARREQRITKMNWLEKHVSSRVLFAVGLACVPAFLLQEALIVKACQAFLFALLCLVSGKRLKIAASAIVLASVTFFNLLVPNGKLLFRVGFLAVTDGAMKSGLVRGLTVTGLFYMSSFCVRRDLKFPGRFGSLLGRTFYYYNLLLQARGFKPKEIIKSLDRILQQAYLDDTTHEQLPRGRTSVPGYLLLLILVLVNWGLAAASLLGAI